MEPLNLGLAVLDGFLCHDGAMEQKKIAPRFGKTWEAHQKDIEEKRRSPEKGINPGTLEGALVKICDTISYIGRDIEDAIALKIISRDEVPATALGKHNRDILTYLAQDLILSSVEKPFITLTDASWEAIQELREFNFKKIYTYPPLKKESKKIEKSYQILFELLLDEYKKQPEKSTLYHHFLASKSKTYVESAKPAEKVIDYISGMTDNYFIRTLENLIVPKRIVL